MKSTLPFSTFSRIWGEYGIIGWRGIPPVDVEVDVEVCAEEEEEGTGICTEVELTFRIADNISELSERTS